MSSFRNLIRPCLLGPYLSCMRFTPQHLLSRSYVPMICSSQADKQSRIHQAYNVRRKQREAHQNACLKFPLGLAFRNSQVDNCFSTSAIKNVNKNIGPEDTGSIQGISEVFYYINRIITGGVISFCLIYMWINRRNAKNKLKSALAADKLLREEMTSLIASSSGVNLTSTSQEVFYQEDTEQKLFESIIEKPSLLNEEQGIEEFQLASEEEAVLTDEDEFLLPYEEKENEESSLNGGDDYRNY